MFPALLGLQLFHVVFLLLHDWVPLPPLNDVHAVRAEHRGWKMPVATLISTLPFAVPLWASLRHVNGPYPHWLWVWLWIAYVWLFVGELHAWWLPYSGRTTAEQVEQYRAMYGRTHAFLPERHGIVPNTMHVMLHTLTLSTLVVLAAMTV